MAIGGARTHTAVVLAAALLPAVGRSAYPDRMPTFTSPAAPLEVVLEWRRGMYGGIWHLRVADLERDGAAEIVGVSAGRWWTAAAQRGAYEQTWVSAPHRGTPGGLAVTNADDDPAREVLVAFGSTIFIYDGLSKRLQDSLPAPGDAVRHLQVADLEGDGARELIFCASTPAPTAVYVYDLATGAQRHVLSGVTPGDPYSACAGLAVGNVDDDAAREIVIGNGPRPGFVVDGITHEVEWENPLGFGAVRLGNVDGDGPAEIVSGGYDDVRIFDARRQTLSLTLGGRGTVLEVADVDRDGFADVLYEEEFFRGVKITYGPGHQRDAMVPIAEHSKYALAIGDLEGDGPREMVVAAADWDSAHLYVADPAARTVRWKSRGDAGPFYGIAYGDVDANGMPDLLHTVWSAESSFEPYFAAGRFFVYGGRRWRLRHVGPSEVEDGRADKVRVLTVNVDDDPQDEVVSGAGLSSYNGTLRCYDVATDELQWRADLPGYRGVASLRAGDVDGDGRVEIVVGTGAPYATYGAQTVVYVFDAASGALEWESPLLGGGASATLLRLAQLDLDAPLEIVVARDQGGDVFVLDGVVRDVKPLGALGVTALDTPDRDGDGRQEIVIATAAGDLRVIDPTSGAVVETVGRYGYRIEGLAIGDYNRDGAADYAFGQGERVRILDGLSRTFLWTSEVLISGEPGYPPVGQWDSLVVADVDRDGLPELVVNTGSSLDVFELRTAAFRPARTRRAR